MERPQLAVLAGGEGLQGPLFSESTRWVGMRNVLLQVLDPMAGGASGPGRPAASGGAMAACRFTSAIRLVIGPPERAATSGTLPAR